MLLQNKFSFFCSFFFTSFFVLSIFTFSPSAEAVGATPPAISYDPYTYENIVPPNGGRSAVNGGKLVQLTGANQLPKLTATYLNDGSNDPWKGGTVRFHWESHVKLTNVLDLVNITAQGFAFVAIIKLPEHVSSSDVLKAIDWNNAYLYMPVPPSRLLAEVYYQQEAIPCVLGWGRGIQILYWQILLLLLREANSTWTISRFNLMLQLM